MIKIAIILGSTRPNRIGEGVAKWAYETAKAKGGAEFELIDLRDQNLPLLDEPITPSRHKYANEHTIKWAEKVGTFDAFIFVTPEYNHSTCAALKNALDFVYAEWNNKVAGFVSYGSVGGSRAVEHLRGIATELKMANVHAQVLLYTDRDFEHYTVFKPTEHHEKHLHKLIDQVISWGTALKTVRV
ncbi:MAG: putative flavoprotein [Bacteroidetes bacterium]|jgi:NAD(P)H-dependent FMN reductase|nr:putative flavoprotein [Bacteroidota bacterium]MDF2453018.1 putative flavoprotein [Bacteroidota bacterium]